MEKEKVTFSEQALEIRFCEYSLFGRWYIGIRVNLGNFESYHSYSIRHEPVHDDNKAKLNPKSPR